MPKTTKLLDDLEERDQARKQAKELLKIDSTDKVNIKEAVDNILARLALIEKILGLR